MKFKVESTTKVACAPDAVSVDLSAVKGEPFGEYTPCGEIKMQIVNPEAAKQIELGKEYFVDIIPAE